MHRCIKCGTPVPAGRVALGYKTCINCSTAKPYTCIAITNHKTANTIQIVSKQVADKVNKLASRKGYGVMTGMKRS